MQEDMKVIKKMLGRHGNKVLSDPWAVYSELSSSIGDYTKEYINRWISLYNETILVVNAFDYNLCSLRIFMISKIRGYLMAAREDLLRDYGEGDLLVLWPEKET